MMECGGEEFTELFTQNAEVVFRANRNVLDIFKVPVNGDFNRSTNHAYSVPRCLKKNQKIMRARSFDRVLQQKRRLYFHIKGPNITG